MEFFTLFMLLFVRQALVVACVGPFVLLILRRIHSPTVHRLACVGVLLVGVSFIHSVGVGEVTASASGREAARLTNSGRGGTPQSETSDQDDFAANVNASEVELTRMTSGEDAPPGRIASVLQFIASLAQNTAPWFFGVWLLGSLLTLVWSVCGYWKFHKQLTVIRSHQRTLRHLTLHHQKKSNQPHRSCRTPQGTVLLLAECLEITIIREPKRHAAEPAAVLHQPAAIQFRDDFLHDGGNFSRVCGFGVWVDRAASDGLVGESVS